MGRQCRSWRHPRERERGWRRPGLGDAYGRCRDPEARWCLWGRRTWTWNGGGGCGDARGSRIGGSGALRGCGGASGSRSGVSERLRRDGAIGGVRAGGGCAARGGGGSRPFTGPGLVAWRVGPVRRRRRGLRVLAWCRLVLRVGVRNSPPSVDLPRRGVVAVAAGGRGRVAVPCGGGPGGALRLGHGACEDTVLAMGGRPLVVGGVVGWSAR